MEDGGWMPELLFALTGASLVCGLLTLFPRRGLHSWRRSSDPLRFGTYCTLLFVACWLPAISITAFGLVVAGKIDVAKSGVEALSTGGRMMLLFGIAGTLQIALFGGLMHEVMRRR